MWPEGGKVAVPRLVWLLLQGSLEDLAEDSTKRSLSQGGAHSHCDCRTSQAPSPPHPILHPIPKFGALLPMGTASMRWDGFCFFGDKFQK